MNKKDFYFNLPEKLIAQYPTKERGQSRLFVYNRETAKVTHAHVSDLIKYIPDDTLIVFNNSRVRKARIFAQSEFGGKVELIFIRPLSDSNQAISGRRWEVLCSKAKRQQPRKTLTLPDQTKLTILSKVGESANRIVEVEMALDDLWFEKNGHIPLPPYIKRNDEKSDEGRYQTLYSSEVGSVAAPTAGLHFTDSMLCSLEDSTRGITTTQVTLHVGLGTFLPVRSENILDHQMHKEFYHVSDEAARLINQYHKEGKNILTIGTTSVRTLESACLNGTVKSGYGNTEIFIYPGYQFKIVNRLFTNFHTPESTLLMLVSAFAGKKEIFSCYQQAIEKNYRFFSYGDAMLFL